MVRDATHFHEAASVFPQLDGAEFDALVMSTVVLYAVATEAK